MPRAKPFDNTAHERPLWLGHQFRTARSLAGDRTSPPELEAPSGSSELRLKPCKEHHREFWLPPMPKGQRDPLTPAVKELQRDYGTKNHVWGKPVTDYRSNGWYIV
ncbi:unnamed protein product [Effrenium voratum]|nr:unnamed protein product [Effrenium voratum]